MKAEFPERGALLKQFKIIAEKIINGEKLSLDELRVAYILWYLNLIAVSANGSKIMLISNEFTERIANEDWSLLMVRVAQWTPMRLLILFGLDKGGILSLDEVVNNLGAKVQNATKQIETVLDFAFGRRWRSPRGEYPRKPFNKVIVKKILFPLGQELGLFYYVRSRYMRVSELAEAFIASNPFPNQEIIKTIPNEPLILVGVSSIIASSNKITVISPWFDLTIVNSVIKPLSNNKHIVIITRRPRERSKHQIALEELREITSEIYYHDHLHTKAVIGKQAIVTSANMIRTSLLRNPEVGIFFRETPPELATHVQEIISISKFPKMIII